MILPELVLFGRAVLWEWFTALWREGEVGCGGGIPIAKKGDLQRCDNWRGICLLDLVGKVFAHIIQERLQVIVAERVLPDSQCGFRKGRGC